jgi:anti-sigma regulatory factor (Ser/Thr protein kinase)
MDTIAPLRGTLPIEQVTDRSPQVARAFVRATLTEFAIDAELIDLAELMVSELVTNVYRHAAGGALVDVDYRAGRISVAVSDTLTSGPTLVMPPSVLALPPAEHGYGLFLVSAFAASVIEVPLPGGKMIAAILPVAEAVSAG